MLVIKQLQNTLNCRQFGIFYTRGAILQNILFLFLTKVCIIVCLLGIKNKDYSLSNHETEKWNEWGSALRSAFRPVAYLKTFSLNKTLTHTHSNTRSEKGENTHHILLTNHPHLGTTKHFSKAVKNTFHFQVKLHKLGPWVFARLQCCAYTFDIFKIILFYVCFMWSRIWKAKLNINIINFPMLKMVICFF